MGAYHAPIVHAAPLFHHAAPAYHAAPVEVYPDEVSPYTYQYAVADDYSNSNFNAAESSNGAGNAEGSYSVALPDGRIQPSQRSSQPQRTRPGRPQCRPGPWRRCWTWCFPRLNDKKYHLNTNRRHQHRTDLK